MLYNHAMQMHDIAADIIVLAHQLAHHIREGILLLML